MLKTTLRRIRRQGKLSEQDAARDRELRRKVQKEFPPLEGEPIADLLSAPLRGAIVDSGKSVSRLAREAKVSAVVLQQFIDGERDLRLATAERLAKILKLKLVAY